MPRAQRTKSAVHEALQRRARHGPGDSFSEELAGETMTIFLGGHSCFSNWCGLWPARIVSLARPAATFTFWRQDKRSSSPPPQPSGLTSACSVAFAASMRWLDGALAGWTVGFWAGWGNWPHDLAWS
jgi:hypothetical protein